MKLKQWICFVMSTVGIVMITGLTDVSLSSNHFICILFGLGAACLYATVSFTISALTSLGWISLAIVGLIHTGITYCMYFTSLKELPRQEAAILSYIDPLVAVIISVTILGEAMSFWQIIGGILILGFTLWNEL